MFWTKEKASLQKSNNCIQYMKEFLEKIIKINTSIGKCRSLHSHPVCNMANNQAGSMKDMSIIT